MRNAKMRNGQEAGSRKQVGAERSDAEIRQLAENRKQETGNRKNYPAN